MIVKQYADEWPHCTESRSPRTGITEILGPKPDNPTCMSRQFAKKLAEFAVLGGTAELHHAVRTWVAERAPLFASCTGAVLCHNDFHERGVWSTMRARVALYNTGPLPSIAEDIRRLAVD